MIDNCKTYWTRPGAGQAMRLVAQLYHQLPEQRWVNWTPPPPPGVRFSGTSVEVEAARPRDTTGPFRHDRPRSALAVSTGSPAGNRIPLPSPDCHRRGYLLPTWRGEGGSYLLTVDLATGGGAARPVALLAPRCRAASYRYFIIIIIVLNGILRARNVSTELQWETRDAYFCDRVETRQLTLSWFRRAFRRCQRVIIL